MKLWTLKYSRGQVKAYLDDTPEAWTSNNGDEYTGLRKLAYDVSITKIAIEKLSQAVVSFPRQVENQVGNIVEELPIKIDLDGLLDKWVPSLQIHGWAAGFVEGRINQRGDLTAVTGLRYVDVESLTIDYNPDGSLKGFWRQINNNRTFYPATIGKDGVTRCRIFYIWGRGLQEIGPNPYPAIGTAKQEAQTLRAITQGQLNYHEHGAIGVHVAKMSVMPPDALKQQIKESLKRIIFRGIHSQGNVELLTKDVDLQNVQTNPDKLALAEIVSQNRQAAAEAFNVPLTIIQPDLAKDRATLRDTIRDWYNGVVHPLARHIITAVNEQILSVYGLSLVLLPEDLIVNQEAELERAGSWQIYVSGGGNPELVAESLGLQFVPGTFDKPEPSPAVAQPMPPIDDTDDMLNEREAEEVKRLHKFIDNGTHLKRPFASDVLSAEFVNSIMQRRGMVQTGPPANMNDIKLLLENNLLKAQLADTQNHVA